MDMMFMPVDPISGADDVYSDIWNSTECFTDADIEPFLLSNTVITESVEIGSAEIRPAEVRPAENSEIDLYYFNNNSVSEV